MDLRESPQTAVNRHPWELARVKALRAIMASALGGMTAEALVLDLGCGDGFLIDGLCGDFAPRIDAVDIHLTADQVSAFSSTRPQIKFHNSYHALTGKGYGVITMFDVLEHVEDDALFVQETLSRFAAPGAIFFCTVPAFQSLFSAHDTFLKHHRRYRLSDLEQVLERAGLRVLRSGYLFGLLLPARAVAVLVERLFGATDKAPGIGHWRHGGLLTSLLTTLLHIDNCVLLWLSSLGIKIPGLTVWAICETPR